MRGASRASTTISASRVAPIINPLWASARRRSNVRCDGPASATRSIAATSVIASSNPDARVEPGIDEVGRERQADIDEGQQRDDRLRNRQVEVADRLIGEISKPVEGEHRLDHHRATQQQTEL